jgi:hypothetical protein
MEIRILVFVISISFWSVIVTFVIATVSYMFKSLTTKLDSAVSEFEKNGEMRQWLDSLQTASAQAVTITQAAKDQMAELEPAITKAQESYNRALAKIDSKLDSVADQVTANAQKARDAVAKPAFSVMQFAAGMAKIFEDISDRDE